MADAGSGRFGWRRPGSASPSIPRTSRDACRSRTPISPTSTALPSHFRIVRRAWRGARPTSSSRASARRAIPRPSAACVCRFKTRSIRTGSSPMRATSGRPFRAHQVRERSADSGGGSSARGRRSGRSSSGPWTDRRERSSRAAGRRPRSALIRLRSIGPSRG